MAPRRKVSGVTLPSSNVKVTNNTSKNARNSNNKRGTNNNYTIDYTNLQISDVLCPLCRNILIEPITLPCQHCFCWRCLQGRIVQQEGSRGAETCPQCQVRFGGWYRTAKKQQKLLTNQPLWNAIRDMFLKTDNPLHPFLTNGQRKKVPATKQVPTSSISNKSSSSRLDKASMVTATPPASLLTVGNDSNDSTCAIRRDCNHFRPIDGHKGHQSSQHVRLGQQVPIILRVPATRSNQCADIVGPSGTNVFFSDPSLSAFCIVRRFMSVDAQTQTPPHQGPTVKSFEESEIQQTTNRNRNMSKINCRSDIPSEIDNQMEDDNKVATNTNATTVIMLQKQSNRFETRQNGLIRNLADAKKSNEIINNNNKVTMIEINNKRKYSTRQKGAQPKRQSARIVAAATTIVVNNNHNHTNQQSKLDQEKNKYVTSSVTSINNNQQSDDIVLSKKQGKHQQVQLQTDRQLARQLHRLLNGGASRRNAANLSVVDADELDRKTQLKDHPVKTVRGGVRGKGRHGRVKKALLRVK